MIWRKIVCGGGDASARPLIRVLALGAVLGSATAVPVAADSDGVAPWVGVTLDGRSCVGRDTGAFGPYDYRISKGKLPVVERHHFNSDVEQLRTGMNSSDPMGDLSYVLLRFPNHHRALHAAMRYATMGVDTPALRENPVECLLQRAVNFVPNDPVPRMLFGMFFHRRGDLERAQEQYLLAEKLAPRDPNIAYNQGLLYFDMGRFAQAYDRAAVAYAGGMPLPGLRRKLEESGHWQEISQDQ